jgi:hypothetical protein
VTLLSVDSTVIGTCTGPQLFDSHSPFRHEGSVVEVSVEHRAMRMESPLGKLVAFTNTYWPSLRLVAGATSTLGQGAVAQGNVAVQPALPSLWHTGAAPAVAAAWKGDNEETPTAVRVRTDNAMARPTAITRRREGIATRTAARPLPLGRCRLLTPLVWLVWLVWVGVADPVRRPTSHGSHCVTSWVGTASDPASRERRRLDIPMSGMAMKMARATRTQPIRSASGSPSSDFGGIDQRGGAAELVHSLARRGLDHLPVDDAVALGDLRRGEAAGGRPGAGPRA